MTTTRNFAGDRAVLLHSSEDVRAVLQRRLEVLGVVGLGRWPELEEADRAAGFLILDIDRAHDEQLPWEAGHAPMPLIGLVGSESPGRLAWAIRQNVDAFIPQGATSKIYSALVIARANFEKRRLAREQDAERARRANMRLDVIRAVLRLMDEKGVDEALALKQLRALAMVERIPLEDAARQILADRQALRGRG